MDLIVSQISTTTYAARVTDAAGNSSALSDEITVFDNQPTNVNGFDDTGSLVGIPGNYADVDLNEFPPVVIDLLGTSDTGLDTTDNVTNLTTPHFEFQI